MHKKINEIIRDISKMGIEIGIVTNGDLLKKLTNESLEKIKWIRISLSDYGTFDEAFIYHIKENIGRGPTVDWSFSYVLMRTPELEKIIRAIKFANDNNFSHVRIVSDLLDLEFVPDMEVIKREIKERGVDDSIVNYQERKDFGLGDERCLISLLKPVIGADGYLYPCCLDGEESILIEREGNIMNIKIKNVMVGDMCFTDNGLQQIISKFERPAEPILEVVLKGGRSIRVSKDHKMIVLKDMVIKDKMKKELSDYSTMEKVASELQIGNLIPVMINAPKYNTNVLSKEMCRILGYYVAEGWTNGTNVGFMFNKKEQWKEDLKRCLEKEGILYKVYDRRTGEQIMCNVDLRNIIRKYGCGNKGIEKQIPTEIFNSDEELKKEFLKAYIRGDGHLYKPIKAYNGFRLQLTTISRKLSSDLTILFSQLGIIARPKIERRAGIMRIEGRTVNVHDIYRVNIAGFYNLEKIRDCFDIEIHKGSRGQKRALAFLKKDNIMFIPIKEIVEIEPENDKLYDITLANVNRFFGGNGMILVHNCGTQYSLKEPTRDYEKTMRMGKAQNIGKLYEKQSWFNGSVCAKCYYKDYNYLLNLLFTEIKHVRFV